MFDYDPANVKMLTAGRVPAMTARSDSADNALFPNQFVYGQLLMKRLA
jgi:hypothetical protein